MSYVNNSVSTSLLRQDQEQHRHFGQQEPQQQQQDLRRTRARTEPDPPVAARGYHQENGGAPRRQRLAQIPLPVGARPLQAPENVNRALNELLEFGPVHLQPEVLHPTIHRGVCGPSNVHVEPPPGSTEGPNRIFLMRTGPDANQAYSRWIGRVARPLDHHAPHWGFVCFAVIYRRINGTFQAPRAEDAEYVAIKVINKRVLHPYLEYPHDAVPPFVDVIGRENPYKEIFRMQQIGDNIHCLACIEALEDNDFLYIVTPMAQGGTLLDAIRLGQPPANEYGADEDETVTAPRRLTPHRIHALFTKILAILRYLHERDVCHHDLSPDNFLFLEPDNLVVFDFGLSVKLPTPANGQRPLLHPAGRFGTFPCMAPEIYHNQVIFDGESADLWSATMILYTMMTNQVLYHLPLPTDISFRYYILAQGLSSVPINERTVEIMMDVFNTPANDEEERVLKQAQGRELMAKSFAHLSLTDPVKVLFEHVLKINPAQRWTVAQVIESPFVVEGTGDEDV